MSFVCFLLTICAKPAYLPDTFCFSLKWQHLSTLASQSHQANMLGNCNKIYLNLYHYLKICLHWVLLCILLWRTQKGLSMRIGSKGWVPRIKPCAVPHEDNRWTLFFGLARCFESRRQGYPSGGGPVGSSRSAAWGKQGTLPYCTQAAVLVHSERETKGSPAVYDKAHKPLKSRSREENKNEITVLTGTLQVLTGTLAECKQRKDWKGRNSMKGRG